MTTLTPAQTLFESETCPRCGGTGRYSFNAINGDRCFGCRGQGVRLTKRGAAAKAHMIAAQQVRAADLTPGMFLWDDSLGAQPRFLPIISVRLSGSYQEVAGVRHHHLAIETRRSTLSVLPDARVRAVRDEAQRQQQVSAALAYQATLTRTGQPAKFPTTPSPQK